MGVCVWGLEIGIAADGKNVRGLSCIPPSHCLSASLSLPFFFSVSPSLHVVMHGAVVSRGAGDCHGHDVISRLLSDVMCCSPRPLMNLPGNIWKTRRPLRSPLSFYHRHLFLSITDYVCMDAWSSDSVIDWFGGGAFRGQAASQVDIRLQVGAEEVMWLKIFAW